MIPDGFVSSVIAAESFDDIKVLLHGPVGCRRDMTFISSIICPKEPKAEPAAYRTRYYANNPRVPCTEVDADDYISGAIDRLEDALRTVSETDDDIIAVINTPGVSLIGDNCEDLIMRMGLGNRALAIDADYSSVPVGLGYDLTLTRILRWLKPVKRETLKDTVNILGLSVFARDWKSVIGDLTGLLEAMGLRVLAVPGTGCSAEEFRNSVNAEFNVAVSSEYCSNLKDLYSEYGIPCADIHEAPVGFDSVEKWILAAAELCGKDPEPALRILDKCRRRAYDGMRSFRGSNSLKGRNLCISGDSTTVLPLVKWLYKYLAIVPVYVRVTDGYDEYAMEKLKEFLESAECSSALTDEMPERFYLAAGDGNTVRRMELGKVCSVGLDLGFPSIYDSDFMRKNVIGQNGALYILERAVNGRPMMSM